VSEEIEAGDHLIVLCDVRDVRVTRPVTPLLFFQGGYGGFSATTSTAHVDADLISAVRLADVSRPQHCEAVALVQINDHDQTIGAAARTASVETHERLGVRMALIPPSGDTAVAWSEEQSAKWLSRVFPQNPEILEMYRARLAAVRAKGHTVHVIPEGRDEAHKLFTDALHEYGMGPLTPARVRAVREVFASAVDFFPTEPLADDEDARVISLTVPVFDPAGDAAGSGLVLRLSCPERLTGAEVAERVAALKSAAAEVSAALGTTHRADYDRYLAADLLHQG
jgi:hypothetical protein